MKRSDFIKIIRIRSIWKTGKGDYKLPNGTSMKRYIETLVESQMKIDSLCIGSDGNLNIGWGGGWNVETKEFDDYTIMIGDNEICSYDEMQRRIKKLINEILG